MTEEQIRNYKLNYTDINIPSHVIEKKWEVIAPMLSEQDKRKTGRMFLPYAAIFVTLVILVVSIIGFTQGDKVQSAVSAITDNIGNMISPKAQVSDIEDLEKLNNVIKAPTATPTPVHKNDKEEVKGAETKNSTINQSGPRTNNPGQSVEINSSAKNSGSGNSSDAKENKTEDHGNSDNPNRQNGAEQSNNGNSPKNN